MLNQPHSGDYETPSPPHPIRKKSALMWLFRILALFYCGVGLYYFGWRLWSVAHCFSFITLVFFIAEILLFIGSLFRIPSYWSYKDSAPQRPVHLLSDIRELNPGEADGPVSIALFIATHNEPLSILKQTLMDCTHMTYPYPDVVINTYLLDDGHSNPDEISALCSQYNAVYIRKKDNVGYKAGNLNNAFHQTNEDLIVILDADTRPFPDFCGHTSGYFRDEELAWVQTPQWYNDTSAPLLPSAYLQYFFGKTGRYIGKKIELLTFQKLFLNKDIYASRPKFFYDAILRNRNAYNAVFSCGAGSVYRRTSLEKYDALYPNTPGPFHYHISEDLYNSMLMHNAGMRSLYHHYPECQMLSPQDLYSWIKQQKRYASGAINIVLEHNPLRKKGLSLIQKILYFSVGYSYFTPLLAYVFFLAPLLYFLTQTNVIPKFDEGFIPLFAMYQSLNLSTFILANWGISTKRPDQKFWASFSYVTLAWLQNLRKEKLAFNVTPKERIQKQSFRFIIPHLLLIIAFFVVPFHYFSSHPVKPLSLFYSFWCLYFIFQLNQFVRVWLWDKVRKD